jgi:hypothetical protein
MRKFFIFTSIILITFIVWLFSLSSSVNREDFIDEKVLAKSVPIDVKIDVELMKSLGSAYER